LFIRFSRNIYFDLVSALFSISACAVNLLFLDEFTSILSATFARTLGPADGTSDGFPITPAKSGAYRQISDRAPLLAGI
jgi:hypothetical protein